VTSFAPSLSGHKVELSLACLGRGRLIPDRLASAGHCDDAGAGEFFDAVGAHQLDEAFELFLGAGQFGSAW